MSATDGLSLDELQRRPMISRRASDPYGRPTPQEAGMPDVSYKLIDEMDGIYGDIARRARAELGVLSGIDSVDVALHGLGRDRQARRECRGIGEAPLLDLVVNCLETPPERPVLECARSPHGGIVLKMMASLFTDRCPRSSSVP